jgi:hypothetical protein
LFILCYEDISAEIVITALIYIDRLLSIYEDQGASLTESNGKGLLHVALTLATKFLMDRYEKNTIFYGSVVGMKPRQMRAMTDAFLSLIDFEMYISEEDFADAKLRIKEIVKEKYSAQGRVVIHENQVRGNYKRADSRKEASPGQF